MTLVCLSAYLSKKKDLHKNVQIEANNFSYIKDYYESIIKNDLNCVIFLDEVSTKFISEYTTSKITFSRIVKRNSLEMLLHDIRFVYFHTYVQNNWYEYYLLSDISDVTVLNSPSAVLALSDDIIYVCVENQNILENSWFCNYLEDMSFLQKDSLLKDYVNVFKDKPILNCGGILAGQKLMNDLLKTLIHFMKYMYNNYDISRPIDMFLINYVCYKFFSKNLCVESNFNTRFGYYEVDNTKFIKHK